MVRDGLVLRPTRAMQVNRATSRGLEPSAIARGVLAEVLDQLDG